MLSGFSPVRVYLWKTPGVRRVAAELSAGVHLQCWCYSKLVRSCVETGGAAWRFLRQDYSTARTRSANQTHSLYVSFFSFAMHSIVSQLMLNFFGIAFTSGHVLFQDTAPQMCATVSYSRGSRVDKSWVRPNPLSMRDFDHKYETISHNSSAMFHCGDGQP